MGRYRKNTNICVRRDIIPFVDISLMITHISCLVLTQVQEIRSSFGLEFTSMSDFENLKIWIYGSWDGSLLPARKYIFTHLLNKVWIQVFS